VLEGEGYTVLTSLSGQQALALLEDRPVDAVVLDFQMPFMDGAEVAQQIAVRWPRIPVILLSAYLDVVPASAMKLFRAVLTKGDGPERLLALVGDILQGNNFKAASAS
jgi:two-component system response regulator FlrC